MLFKDSFIANANKKIRITYIDLKGQEHTTEGFCTYDAYKNPTYHDGYGKEITREHVIEWEHLK